MEKTIINQKFQLEIKDWNEASKDGIADGHDFRVTEGGKSDINTEPGYYSIHSPLFGTDYGDEHAFEDRHSCACGNLIGKDFEGVVCPKCKKKVEFVDIDMTITGWIIMDNYHILNPTLYRKLRSFIGGKTFDAIVNFEDHLKRVYDPTHPFSGIGLIEFYERFDEVLEYYRTRSKKDHLYKQIMEYKNAAWISSIPVFSSHLRLFVINGDEIKYSEEDKLYKQIFTNVDCLNSGFVLTKRIKSNMKRRFKVEDVRDSHLLQKIQEDVNKLWNRSFEAIKEKSGVIRELILGGRVNFTGRNVIIPVKSLRADQIILGYTTFMHLFKLEIISELVAMYGISHNEAWDKWESATINFDETVYKVITHIVNNRKVYFKINRNPTIAYGSQVVCRVVYVEPDIDDHTMGLPESILTKLNADFDGDVLNMLSLKLDSVGEEYYLKMNPRNNAFIDRNDGLYDEDMGLFKDQIIGLYAFCTI